MILNDCMNTMIRQEYSVRQQLESGFVAQKMSEL